MRTQHLKAFQQRLTKTIRTSGLKNKQIVESSGGKIQYTHLWIWQNGETYPSIPKLIILARILNVSLDYLLEGKNDK